MLYRVFAPTAYATLAPLTGPTGPLPSVAQSRPLKLQKALALAQTIKHAEVRPHGSLSPVWMSGIWLNTPMAPAPFHPRVQRSKSVSTN